MSTARSFLRPLSARLLLAPLGALLLLSPLAAPARAQRATRDLRGSGGVQVNVKSFDQRDAITGAEVSLVAAGRGEATVSGFTDSSGRIAFVGVGGAYELIVKKEGYETQRENIVIASAGRENFIVTLRRSKEGASPRASTVSARKAAVPEAAREAYDAGVASLQNDPAKSVEHFRRAINEFPEYAEAYMMLGYAELRRGQKGDAVAALSKAVELDTGLAQAHLLLGKIYLDDRKPKEAEKPLRQSVGLDPQSSEAHLRLAHCLYVLGKPDEALRLARRSLELPGASPLTHLLISDIHLSRDEKKEALQALEKFEKADPQSPFMPRVRERIERLRAEAANR